MYTMYTSFYVITHMANGFDSVLWEEGKNELCDMLSANKYIYLFW